MEYERWDEGKVYIMISVHVDWQLCDAMSVTCEIKWMLWVILFENYEHMYKCICLYKMIGGLCKMNMHVELFEANYIYIDEC